jgi:predicted ester cyclase
MNSEENKALLRQFIEEFDQNWGTSVDYLDKWFTDDVKLHFNGVTMDLAGFKEMLPPFYSAFADLRHEVHFMVAEDDLVTSVQTIHMKHIGEWEGIAPTGGAVSLADIAVLRRRDDKFAEEWVAMDMAGLKQQLEAPSKESE